MSEISHDPANDDVANDEARAMTIPKSFLRKQLS